MTIEEAKKALGIGVYGSGLLYTDNRSLPMRPQSGVHVGFLHFETLELSICAIGFSRILIPFVEKHAAGLRCRRGQVCRITDQIAVVLGTDTFLMTSADTVQWAN